MSDHVQLKDAYEAVKASASQSHLSAKTKDAVKSLCDLSLSFLVNKANKVDLVSRVPGKVYYSYQSDKAIARPANAALFLPDPAKFNSLWNSWNQGTLDKTEGLQLLYTAALAPCLAMELFDKQNKKGPATYFECFIGHLFAAKLKVEPTRNAKLVIEKSEVRLTMDFLFDLTDGSDSYHVPVKMSTRERVVQAWAHQRLLDSAYGVGKYKGVMMLFSETKLDSRNLEVVEICVPDQWLAYQMHLARMQEIYYFDLPQRYVAMAAQHPTLFQLRPVSDFFI